MLHRTPVVATLALLLLAARAGAQSTPPPLEHETRSPLGWPAAPLDGPLVADRPDFTESVDAVPRGRLQLEAGYTFTYDDDNGATRSHGAPETLLRIGLVDDLELRIAWPSYTWLDSQGADAEGLEDLVLGFKIKLFDQDGARPHFGIIAQASLPTGADDVSSGDVDPEVKLLWAYDLNERLSLAGNLNFGAPTSDDGRFFQSSASVSLAASLTESIGAYIEYFGHYPVDRGEGPAHHANGGFTFLITNNLQFDVRIGAGLNDRADDLFAGAGFAVRF